MLLAPAAGEEATDRHGERTMVSVAFLATDQLVAWGILYYAFNVFSPFIARDLGVSEKVTAAAFSLCLLVSGLLGATVGRWLDRKGPRPVLLWGAAVGSFALAGLGLVRTSGSLVAVMALLGGAHALALYEPAFATVVRWFPHDPKRSRGLLLLTCIAGFASTVFIPVASQATTKLGWRATALGLSATALVLCFSLRWWLTSQVADSRPFGSRSTLTLGRPPLSALLLGVSFALQALVSTGVMVRLIWHIQEKSVSLAMAAVLAGLAGASQVPGRLLMLPLNRLLPAGARIPVLLCLHALGLVGVAAATGPLLVAAIVLFGASGGMMTLARPSVVATWFGAEGFGTRNGQIVTMGFLARAGSPFLLEVLHARMSYARAFGLLSMVLLIAAAVAAAAFAVHARAPTSISR